MLACASKRDVLELATLHKNVRCTDRNSVDIEQPLALECVTFWPWKQTIASDEH